MAAEVIKFGEPENESERLAIQYLQGHLPDTYRLYTNLEIPRDQQLYEVDIILVAPHAVYIIDVKGVYGQVEVDYHNWYPENRQAYPSPLKKYRQHARALSGLIIDTDLFRKKQLRRILVQATVLLTTENASIVDVSRDGDQAKDIVRLNEPGLKYFQDWQSIDTTRYDSKIELHRNIIDRAIRGRSKPRNRTRRFGSWEVIEELGEREGKYVEYLARKVTVGLKNQTGRLRVYSVDPLLDAKEREQEYRLINTAFQAVDDLPSHDNILRVQDIFESNDATSLVLVVEDRKGQSLRQVIRAANFTLEQKINVMGDVLRALEHTHKHGVIHRNITPDSIFITPEKQAKIGGFDYARIENRTGTIAHEIQQDLEAFSLYQDFDCHQDPSKACEQSDLYAAGQVFYELLRGKTAFDSVEEMVERSGIFPALPSQQYPDLPKGFDEWLQKLCAWDRGDRFQSAREALDQLTPLSKVKPDLVNIPVETVLNNQYQVIERLGKPGSFAVAYKVLHSYSEDFQVMKIAIRDPFNRVHQEFKALYQVLKYPHPHIVTARWPGELHDYNNTPFLIFEYVEGQDLEEYFTSHDFSLEEALEVTAQTASGLAHLHAQNIYHQDIKPSNLLITQQGVKIIDFNVAVTIADESTITAGTKRYLPPDYRLSVEPSESERIDRDLYALGIVAYECITGYYPFNAAKPVLGQDCLDPRQFKRCEDLSEALVNFLRKALAPKRSDRFQSAQALLEALEAIRNPRPAIASPELRPTDLEVIDPEVQPDLEAQPEKGLPKAEVEVAAEDSTPVDLLSETLQPVASQSETSQSSEASVKPEIDIVVPSVVQAFDSMVSPSPIAAEATPIQPQSCQLLDWLSDEPRVPPNPNQPIVLDPSGVYSPPQDYILIESEMDWMQKFNANGAPYWIKGKTLCDWTKAWLRCWNRSHLLAEGKQPPREKLKILLEPLPIPNFWTEQQCLAVVTRLETYPEPDPIAHLLADLTESDPQVWLAQPTIENLAQWLTISVPEEAIPLEQAWQAQRPQSDLHRYYQATDKLQLLRQWLGIAEPKLTELGLCPLSDLPPSLQAEYEKFWERELHRTRGSILSDLDLAQQAVPQRVVGTAYQVFKQHPDFITSERKKQLKGYINYEQYQELNQHQRPLEPQPLSPGAKTSEVLQWVIQGYLPLRRWETVTANLPQDQQVCDRLAASFEAWLLEHYPSLTAEPVANSRLNYNVSHHVQELCAQGPVFWVVVDGLGWLDHQELLALLTKLQRLQLERDLEPRLSILPTKTEYAKWSLYSQRLPGNESWKPDAGEGFKINQDLTQKGKRYTDHDVTKQRLQKDLQSGEQQFYCWDTDRFDKLFHDEVDWEELYKFKRPRELRDIAEDILRMVDMHPQKELLRVVIASDHGQIMGKSNKLSITSANLERQGRMAIGKTDHPQLAVLDRQRFNLPHDISVIRGSSSFNAFSYAEDKSIIGCHGGLYPEEVVVGFSVLTRSVQRAPVIVKCSGSGRAGETGILKVEIDNPNSLSITDLTLTVFQIVELQPSQELNGVINSTKPQSFEVEIQSWPELPLSYKGNVLPLSGKLEFYYQNAERGMVELDKDSAIVVKQIFSSGLESGLDDFI